MGEKRVEGAKLARPLGHLGGVSRQDGQTMIRSSNVFAGAVRQTARKARKRAARAGGDASARKPPAKDADAAAETRMRNLRKANKALKRMRASK